MKLYKKLDFAADLLLGVGNANGVPLTDICIYDETGVLISTGHGYFLNDYFGKKETSDKYDIPTAKPIKKKRAVDFSLGAPFYVSTVVEAYLDKAVKYVLYIPVSDFPLSEPEYTQEAGGNIIRTIRGLLNPNEFVFREIVKKPFEKVFPMYLRVTEEIGDLRNECDATDIHNAVELSKDITRMLEELQRQIDVAKSYTLEDFLEELNGTTDRTFILQHREQINEAFGVGLTLEDCGKDGLFEVIELYDDKAGLADSLCLTDEELKDCEKNNTVAEIGGKWLFFAEVNWTSFLRNSLGNS